VLGHQSLGKLKILVVTKVAKPQKSRKRKRKEN